MIKSNCFVKAILGSVLVFLMVSSTPLRAQEGALIEGVAKGIGKFGTAQLLESFFGTNANSGATPDQVNKIVAKVVHAEIINQTKEIEQYIRVTDYVNTIKKRRETLSTALSSYQYLPKNDLAFRKDKIFAIQTLLDELNGDLLAAIKDTRRPTWMFLDLYKSYIDMLKIRLLTTAEKELVGTLLAKSGTKNYVESNGSITTGAALEGLKESASFWKSFYPGPCQATLPSKNDFYRKTNPIVNLRCDCVHAQPGTQLFNGARTPLYTGRLWARQGPKGVFADYRTQKMNHSLARSMDVKGLPRGIWLRGDGLHGGDVNKICSSNSWASLFLGGAKYGYDKIQGLYTNYHLRPDLHVNHGHDGWPAFEKSNRVMYAGNNPGHGSWKLMQSFDYWNGKGRLWYQDERIQGKSMFLAPMEDKAMRGTYFNVMAYLFDNNTPREKLIQYQVALSSDKYTSKIGNIKELHKSLVNLIFKFKGKNKKPYRKQALDAYNYIFCSTDKCPNPI